MQGLQHGGDLRNVREVLKGLLNVHVQHIADTLALEPDVQGFAVEPLALADRACYPDIGQKIHLQTVGTIPLAGLAAAAGTLKLNRPGW